jgi:hypothetical protein
MNFKAIKRRAERLAAASLSDRALTYYVPPRFNAKLVLRCCKIRKICRL